MTKQKETKKGISRKEFVMRGLVIIFGSALFLIMLMILFELFGVI